MESSKLSDNALTLGARTQTHAAQQSMVLFCIQNASAPEEQNTHTSTIYNKSRNEELPLGASKNYNIVKSVCACALGSTDRTNYFLRILLFWRTTAAKMKPQWILPRHSLFAFQIVPPLSTFARCAYICKCFINKPLTQYFLPLFGIVYDKR